MTCLRKAHLAAGVVLLLGGLAVFNVRAADDDASKTAQKEAAPKDPKTMTADELEAAGLCPVKRIESKQIYHYELNGKTYHFCCRKCQSEFEEHPEKYGVK